MQSSKSREETLRSRSSSLEAARAWVCEDAHVCARECVCVNVRARDRALCNVLRSTLCMVRCTFCVERCGLACVYVRMHAHMYVLRVT